jgi:hypothetical protein
MGAVFPDLPAIGNHCRLRALRSQLFAELK